MSPRTPPRIPVWLATLNVVLVGAYLWEASSAYQAVNAADCLGWTGLGPGLQLRAALTILIPIDLTLLGLALLLALTAPRRKIAWALVLAGGGLVAVAAFFGGSSPPVEALIRSQLGTGCNTSFLGFVSTCSGLFLLALVTLGFALTERPHRPASEWRVDQRWHGD